jgi:putative hydroxymethylpyrimidine transport system substrate-binding protein
MLDYFPNADHAGIYAAQAAGEYRKAGLDVKIVAPPDPSAPLKLLRAGKADAVISYEPELLLARDHGATNLVGVGALVQTPLTSLMSIGSSKVRSPKDLAGKRVATAGIPYQSAYLKTILEKAGVDPGSVKETNVGFNLVPAMLSKKADATLGAFWNIEGVELERRHKDPRILRMDAVGVPTYNELVIVAREQDVRKRGPMLRRFMRALALGHQAVRDDPAKAVGELVHANPDLERGLQRAQVKATLPVFFPKDKDKPFGWQDPVAWKAYTQWMLDNDLLASPAGTNRAFTNEFLPGEGI